MPNKGFALLAALQVSFQPDGKNLGSGDPSLMPVKSKMKILQNFVAFSEYMNFIYLIQLGILVEFLHPLCRHLYSTHHQHKLHLFDEKNVTNFQSILHSCSRYIVMTE